MHDDTTAEYFEQHVHDYSPARLAFAVEEIRRRATPNSTLLDAGCGTGTLLELIASGTGVTRLTGMDPSARALTVATDRVACDTVRASILDPDLPELLPHRFDFVVLAAVVHHLVGRTRRDSRRMAADAIARALDLLVDGGMLVIVEPTFTPRWAMDLVFGAKRAVTRFTTRRVELLGRWNNLGAPVVSYYSPDELRDMVTAAGGTVVAGRDVAGTLRRLPRLLGVTGRWDTTLIVTRPAR